MRGDIPDRQLGFERPSAPPTFLAGGGEMGERMRAFAWESTPLGVPAGWPQSLKTIIRVMLDSRYAMWMLWGSEYTFFCNDACLPMVGIKREWVLGARADIVWEDVWADVRPRVDSVLTRGEATWDEALLLYLERSGFAEETYHTFSYSPIYDDDNNDDNNNVAGMLCIVTEVTERVIGERCLHALRDDETRKPDDNGEHLPGRERISEGDRRFEKTFGSHVLVADDNADMRAYIHSLLSPYYTIETVADGIEAMAAIERNRPDLVLSDVMMPRLDGIELIARLRAHERTRDLPVVLLSARVGESERIEGFDAGADDYLAKPFFARELLTRVGALLELTQMRRENEAILRLRQAQLETLFTEAPLGIFLVDTDFCIREANPIARVAFDDNELVGKNFDAVMRALFDDDFAAKVVAVFRHTLISGAPSYTAECTETRRDRDSVESYEWLVHRLPLADGSVGAVCYFRDISAQVQARQAQAAQQELLEAANKQKDQFLAMLAHELRNPLAPIGNASELLARLVAADSSAQAAVDMIQRQMRHLTRLVDDLLDVSRITQGRVELQLERVDIGEVIAQGIETIEPLARAKQQNIVSGSDAASLFVKGDLTRLVQCLVNILANAVKYSERGGDIRIDARVEDDNAVIAVADEGAGIAPALLPHIFELFVQGERSLDRAQGGLGIGLSVVKGVIEMHGGRVEAFSAGIGAGARIVVHLPLLRESMTNADKRGPVRSLPKTILVVDDNVDAANSLAMLLTLTGHSTRTANSGRDALQCLADTVPDIAILDIGLPEMDGYALASAIRRLPHLQRIKLIALTGYGQPEDRLRAQQAGFDRHLTKPIEFETLRMSLEAL